MRLRIDSQSKVWRFAFAITLVSVAMSMLLVGLLQNWLIPDGQWHRIGYAVALITPLLVATPVSYALGHLMWRLHESEDAYRKLAQTDSLTGLRNRSNWTEAVERLLARTSPDASCAILIDVDHFKRINDEQGHRAGDQTLQMIARVLGQAARPQDLLGRLGGDEFVVFLPSTALPVAVEQAERLRALLGGGNDNGSRDEGMRPFTVSLGVATTCDGNLAQLVDNADRALYAAKHEGRNRVHAAAV